MRDLRGPDLAADPPAGVRVAVALVPVVDDHRVPGSHLPPAIHEKFMESAAPSLEIDGLK